MKITSDERTIIDGGSIGVAIGDHVGGDYLEVRPDGEVVMHGTAKVLWHEHAGSATLKKGAIAPDDGFVGITPTLDFSNLREESAHFVLEAPFGMQFASDIDVKIDWCHTLGHDPDPRVRWELEYTPVVTGGSVAATPTVMGVTTMPGQMGGFMCRCTMVPQMTGVVEMAAVGLRLYRNHDHGDDGLGGDGRLITMHYHFLMNKIGQAT